MTILSGTQAGKDSINLRENRKEHKLVSIIMPAYNEERYIGEAIQSLINQTYPNWELIIVDDFSQDKTVEIINQYMSQDSRIRLYKFPENRGACTALNEALGKMKGDYICWLSADDKYKADMLESSILFLAEHEKMQAVFSRHEFINEESELVEVWEPDERYLNIGQEGSVEPYYSMIFWGNAFNACTVFATAKAFQKAGFFNTMHLYAGDYDYMLRLAAYSNIGFLNKVNVQSRIHKGQVTNEGKNDIDAIHVYEEMLSNHEVRKKIFQKAGIKEGREEILATFSSRVRMYKGIGKQKEVLELERVIDRYLREFPLIKEADTYCDKVSKYINLQQWEEAEKLFRKITDETNAFINKENWGIIAASILEHREDYVNEKEILEIVLEINKENYEAYYMLGTVYEREGDNFMALDNYAASVKNSRDKAADCAMLTGNLKRFINEKL